MNGDKLVIQKSCRPTPRGRSAAVMFAGILLLCGCGTKPATPPASPAAANPGTSIAPPATSTAPPAAAATAAPSPAPTSAGTPAATPGPSRNPPTAPGTAAPPPTPPTPPAPASPGRLVLALDVPAGEVLAELAKNFRRDANPHPDSVGTGTWSYALWGTANPWESPRERSPLAPQVGDSSKPGLAVQAQRPNQPVVAAQLLPREGSGVAILAPENSPGYVGLRWQSGVEGQVAIVGKYGWDQPAASGDLEVLVFVDGILRSHQLLPPGMTSASAFEVKADVQPGSAVDLVVGMLVFQPEKAPNQGTLALDAAIVRTSPRPALELAADSVAKVAQAWRTAPRRPLPKTDDCDQSPDLAKVRLEWYRRVFLGAFRNTYPDDGATKGAIDNFLDGYFRQVAGEEAAPSDGELLAQGKAAMPPGKADAVGYTALGTIALRHGNNEDFNYGFVRLGYAEHWFVKQSYPALVRFWYRATLPAIYQRMRDQVKGQREGKAMQRQAADELAQAVSAPDLTDGDRQMILRLVEANLEPNPVPLFTSHIVGRVNQAAQADPWIREMLLAREHLRLGWAARGTGFANEVGREDWAAFHSQIRLARLHALAAWKLRPELPESASLMIAITMAGEPVAEEDTRFWLDEALAADLRCVDAYKRYVWSLRPRWGGSHEAMLAFARECLATGRFDTRVPAQFGIIVHDVGSELTGVAKVLQIPGVLDDYLALLQGYEAEAKDDRVRQRHQTQRVALYWLAGRKSEAREALAALGNRVQGSGFELFGLTYSQVARDLRDENRPFQSSFDEQKNPSSLLAFVPGDNRLLAAEADGQIAVWNVATGRREQVLKEHTTPLVALAVHPETKRLLSVSEDGRAVVWRADKLEVDKRLEATQPAQAAGWNPDGSQLLLVQGDEQALQVTRWSWEQDQKSTLPFPARAAGRALSVAEAAPGRPLHLVFRGNQPDLFEKRLVIWHDGHPPTVPALAGIPQGLTSVTLARQGSSIMFGGLDTIQANEGPAPYNRLLEFDLAAGKLLGGVDWLPSRVTSIVPLADGKRAVATCSLGSIVVADMSTHQIEGCVRTGFAGLANLALASDESWAAATDRRGAIHVFPLKDHNLEWQITSPLLDTNLGHAIRKIGFVGEGKLTVETEHGGVSRWDWATGCRRAEQYLAPTPKQVSPAPFPDGRRIAFLAPEAEERWVCRVIDMEKKVVEQTLAHDKVRFTALAVARQGDLMAIGDETGTVILVDSKTYQMLPWGVLREHRSAIGTMCFSPDGTALVTSTHKGEVKWWDLPARPDANTKPPVSRFTVASGRYPFASLDISSDNSRLACGQQGTEVFDVATGRRLYDVPGAIAAFSPDGTRLLAGYLAPRQLSSARVYDAATGRALARLEGGHAWPVWAVAFSPDGKTALTGDTQGVLRAWDVETGVEVLDIAATK